MKNKVTDRDNKNILDEAYKISEGIVKEKRYTSDGGFKVLAVEDNKSNGMQAMAVAPIVNGEVGIV